MLGSVPTNSYKFESTSCFLRISPVDVLFHPGESFQSVSGGQKRCFSVARGPNWRKKGMRFQISAI